jgi:phosphotransferase system enzyme I (PtsI)
MFPFVSGPGELRVALLLLEQAKAELRAEGVAFREDVPVGVNLEVPSAALVADLLAPEVDFFSVGTNDLIQYLLAVDRTDPRVSALYEPLHPAVLRTLGTIASAARDFGRPLSVCGEMAGQPLEAVLLVGLGFRSLSMAPSAIPRVKEALRAVRASDAQALAKRCLDLSTCAEIEALVRVTLAPFESRTEAARGSATAAQ